MARQGRSGKAGQAGQGNATKLEAPKLDVERLLPAELSESTRLQTKDFFSHGVVRDITIADQEAHKVTFDSMLFQRVTFFETALHALEVTDVVLEKCDLSNVDWSDAVLHRVVFRDCKMVGTNLTGATLRNVRFERCFADYAAFRFSDARQVEWQECSLNKADFSYMKQQKVAWQQCEIDQAQLSGTKLTGVDLSTCTFYGLGVNAEDVQGCTITREQAYVFVNLFGMILKVED